MPGIAESWTVNADGSYTFTLRDDAVFHDGTPVTAEDVEYSMHNFFVGYYGSRYGFTNHSVPVLDVYFNVTYSSPDSKTVTVSSPAGWMDGNDWPPDLCGAVPIYMLTPSGSFDPTGEIDNEEDMMAEWGRAPVGAGPYKFVEWQAEDYILLERFDDWFGWGETLTASDGRTFEFPTIAESFQYVKFRIVEEKAIALVELKTGGLDLTVGRFSSKAALDNVNSTDGFKAYMLETFGGAAMQTNIQGDWPTVYGGPGNYPVSDVNFRKALAHAIDRQNIVDASYEGLAGARDGIFPDYILEQFDVNQTGFYNFSFNVAKAEAILDAQGWTADRFHGGAGFSDEPDNRFGHGWYANESQVQGVNQTKGRHFRIVTINCDFCIKRALAIQKDLKSIGIYVDLDLLEWGQYRATAESGMSGDSYNATGPQPDPNYEGAPLDFIVGGFGGWYKTPQAFVNFYQFNSWYSYDGSPENGWLNETYEIGIAKVNGGQVGNGNLVGFGIPDTEYPSPEWKNTDSQFMEGLSEAGNAISHGLPFIPLVFYVDTYAMVDNVMNLMATRSGQFHCAYAYWDYTV
jgi:ABC-type transport system substrate-binding protein